MLHEPVRFVCMSLLGLCAEQGRVTQGPEGLAYRTSGDMLQLRSRIGAAAD